MFKTIFLVFLLYGEPVPGLDPIDYNRLYLTICPNCHFTVLVMNFLNLAKKMNLRSQLILQKMAEVQAELTEKYEE